VQRVHANQTFTSPSAMPITLTATALKRRSIASIEKSLMHGPIQITKRNKTVAVLLSVEEYQRLVDIKAPAPVGMTAAQWLLMQSSRGRRNKTSIANDHAQSTSSR